MQSVVTQVRHALQRNPLRALAWLLVAALLFGGWPTLVVHTHAAPDVGHAHAHDHDDDSHDRDSPDTTSDRAATAHVHDVSGVTLGPVSVSAVLSLDVLDEAPLAATPAWPLDRTPPPLHRPPIG